MREIMSGMDEKDREYCCSSTSPLSMTVTCPVLVWPEVYRFMDCSGEMTPGTVYVFSTLWFDSGYKFGVNLRLLLEKFHIFYVKGTCGSYWKSGHYFNKQLL